uniref:J domain-containing protein n=1 Tax=viral metagenome TaxID=1070528 RepID=A0A6C0ACI9_9ZZZZ
MHSIDLYDVLNITKEASKKDVIKAYRELVKKYHPDRPEGDADLFELINHAFDTLSNEEKRKSYNDLQEMSDKVNKEHRNRKSEFDNYLNLQSQSEISKSKDQSELEFKETMMALDDKRNFDRVKYEEEQENKLSKEDLKDLQNDIMLEREQDDIEYQPENIFEGQHFDIKKFNKMWDVAKKKSQAIVEHNRPSSMNDHDEYVGIDADYGELFGKDAGNDYVGVNFSSPLDTLTAEDLKNLDSDEDNDGGYESHNKGRDDPNYKKSLEELMAEREKETQQINNMQFNDFNTDIKDGYGFLHQVGFDKQFELDYEDSKDMNDRYEKLLHAREQEDEVLSKNLKHKMEKLKKDREN